MIYDTLDNLNRYTGLGSLIEKGLKAMAQYAGSAPGRYELESDRLYLMVQEYTTAPAAEKLWETHRRYIDIQYVHSGNECIGIAPAAALTVGKPYDEEGDAEMYTGQGTLLPCPAGTVVILYPGEAHMPGAQAATACPVRKLVAKVQVD